MAKLLSKKWICPFKISEPEHRLVEDSFLFFLIFDIPEGLLLLAVDNWNILDNIVLIIKNLINTDFIFIHKKMYAYNTSVFNNGNLCSLRWLYLNLYKTQCRFHILATSLQIHHSREHPKLVCPFLDRG